MVAVATTVDVAKIVRRNPATGEVVGEVPVLGAAEVRAVVERGRVAQRSWGALPPAERGEALQAFRRALATRGRELADLIAREQGKALTEAYVHDIIPLLDTLKYYGKRAAKVLAPERIPLHYFPHRRSYVHFVPRGVVGVIGPWNFPLILALRDAVMALLAGNAAVVKPSEHTPLIIGRAKEVWDEAGMPPDLLQVVTGYGETGAALVEGGVDMVVFTGSVRTGKKVAVACAERLIPCVMELGGKAAAIVCADADPERTAQGLLWGAFANSGQVCASVERVYVHEAVFERVVDRVSFLAGKLRQGPGTSPDVDVGAMCWDKQADKVEEHVRDAVEKGAKVVAGGKRNGQFFQPTVLVNCDHSMKVMREETFGPLMPIMKVRDEEEAIALANDSHLGLLGYVWTRDNERGKRIAERMEAGTVMVNDTIATAGMPETPWGGVKQSGLGFVNSDESLRHLCEQRHVHYDVLNLLKKEFYWFPYSSKNLERIGKIAKLIFG